MAALSYYANNFDSPFQQMHSNMSTLFDHPQTQLLPELDFDFHDFNCGNFDDLFDQNDIFYADEHLNNQTFSFQPDQNSFTAITNPIDEPFLLQQEFEPFPKHQKPNFSYEEVSFCVPQPALFNDELLVPSNFGEQYLLPEITAPPPTLPAFPNGPPHFSHGYCEQRSTKQNASPQSLTARKRRKKITDKTQELSKLIPGAHKLNTAEMFQAAYKYIKFLQAQAGILQFSGSYNHNQESVAGVFQSEEMHNLLESPIVQEKLYLTENCVVSKNLVQELSFDEEMFESEPRALKEIRQLLN